MSHRCFFRIFIVFIGVFVAVQYFIWVNWTKVLLTKEYDGGDLARLGYQPGSKEFRKIQNDLPQRHLDIKEFRGQTINILTIGDSFSNGGGEGRNSFYQDYIASINKCTVMNVPPYPTDDLVMMAQPLSTLAVLYNSGYLDMIRPRCIIIQSAERYALLRLSFPFTFHQNDTLANVRKFYENRVVDWDYLPKVSFMNEGNFEFLYNNLLYIFSDNAFRGLVYRMQLDRPLFSVKESSTLLVYGDEIRNLKLAADFSIRSMNDNLNRLHDLLAARGIMLYFMPTVDKYNLYSDFIVGNRYPRSIFFEELRKLPHRYELIDTKKILLERLNQGEKDIFYADDTHWTWRASQAIFERVPFTGCCEAATSSQSGFREDHVRSRP